MYSKQHKLHWPISIDGSHVDTVEIKTVTVEQHRKAFKDNDGDDKALIRALICESTGLTPAQQKQLTVPDYNSIQAQVIAFVEKPSSEFLDEKLQLYKPTLLVPITGADGKLIKSYRLTPPTVELTDVMEAHDDDWDQTMLLTMSCTGLSQSDIMSLALPDWTFMQNSLADFLQKKAEFFRQKT